MKITRIEPIHVGHNLLVGVHTDEGVVGYGECSPMNNRLVEAHLDHALVPLAVGSDPFDVEAIVEKLFVSTYKLAGQSMAMAVSGIEIALWDIMGKALGQPIYKLLGGAYRKQIRMYASSMRRDISPADEAKRLADLVEKHGFSAVKVRVGSTFGFDEDAAPGRSLKLVREVRAALGDDIEIMVDGNSCFTAPRAIELGRRLQEYRVFHFEEPCPYWDLDSTAKVAKALDLPIAGGEQDWGLHRFREMLEQEAVDVVQPDLIKAGGFSVCKKVAHLAEAFGRVCTPHQTQPLGTLANLHFAAATPNVRYSQEYNIEPNPLMQSLFRGPALKVRDGHLAVPEGPGLGAEINEELLASE
ncbi:MAG: mandelate racemase/muconate lactonizing enzyme family protein [Armatimonadota bacterium]|nr:MAG: mandelate racemase/muconate lactonizing enzyme family protein [Armatimonadota bacterium]